MAGEPAHEPSTSTRWALALILGVLALPAWSQTPSPAAGDRVRTDSWPMHRGDLLNTGVSRSATDADQGRIVWKFYAAHRIAQSPAVVDGVLYVGDWGSIFYAVDAKTGKLIWRSRPRTSGGQHRPLPPEGADITRSGNPWEQKYNFSSPVVTEERVITITEPGIVTAFRRADGEVEWERDFEMVVYSSPRVADGKVIFGGTDHVLYALDEKTGETVWTYSAGDWIGSTCAITKGGSIIFPSFDKHLHVVDLATGELKRRHDVGYRSTGSPLVAFGCVYMCTSGRKFMCFDLLQGRVRWEQPSVNEHQQGVGLWRDQVMVHIARTLYCFDANTGKPRWKYVMKGAGAISPCVGRELVYACDETGVAHAVELSSGKARWTLQFGEKVRSWPVLVDGLLYVCDGVGRVCAIE